MYGLGSDIFNHANKYRLDLCRNFLDIISVLFPVLFRMVAIAKKRFLCNLYTTLVGTQNNMWFFVH